MTALLAAILALLHPHPAPPTTVPRPTTTTAVTQPKPVASPQRALGGIWACIRAHESGGNYQNADTGNSGHFGAYQMARHTWDVSVTGAGWPQYANGRADLAPPAVQDSAAVWLQAHYGWSQWSTSRGCGA